LQSNKNNACLIAEQQKQLCILKDPIELTEYVSKYTNETLAHFAEQLLPMATAIGALGQSRRNPTTKSDPNFYKT
jgi:hypothetical protein